MPEKPAVNDAQIKGAYGKKRVPTALGSAEAENQGMFCLGYHGYCMLWILDLAKELETRLMACVLMQEAGCRRVNASIRKLSKYFVWKTIKEDVREFVSGCLNFVDYQAGGLVPRSLSDIIHVTKVGEGSNFCFCAGDS